MSLLTSGHFHFVPIIPDKEIRDIHVSVSVCTKYICYVDIGGYTHIPLSSQVHKFFTGQFSSLVALVCAL